MTTDEALPAEAARALLQQMLRIRHMEERCAELYGMEKIRGFLHLCIGEEAIAPGVMRALGPDDAVVATYREHAHALMRGVPMDAIVAEMFGKGSGCCHGRGGSMHLFDARTRFFGGYAIVAGGMPVAVGLALADRLQQRRGVTACFLGDGAVAEGEFHESLNLAALWRLPVLFCCENNGYAMGTAIERALSQTNLCVLAESHKVPARSVDGMDPLAVAEAAGEAVRRVRSGEGPFFLELKTYRFCAHSMFDPQLYREKREVDAWRERDPIKLLTARLRQAGQLDDAQLGSMERAAQAEVERAVAAADAAPWAPVAELLEDVGAERGSPP